MYEKAKALEPMVTDRENVIGTPEEDDVGVDSILFQDHLIAIPGLHTSKMGNISASGDRRTFQLMSVSNGKLWKDIERVGCLFSRTTRKGPC